MPLNLNDVRLHVYRAFADDGAAATPDGIAAAFGSTPAAALAALRELDDAHLVVLDPGRQRIVMAHPWAAVPLGFVVASSTQKWWGGCAWDSFAIPGLAGETCLVATHCPGCGDPIALDVAPDDSPDLTAWQLVAHLPVPVLRMWDDVVATCRSQLLFCHEGHLADWLAATGTDRGAVLDMHQLWRLATGWYAGRLTAGYRRRTPAEAAQFFAGIGLTGEFWRTQ
ncbi:MAG: organomercurial lyase [Actinomycetota bacterium]